MRKIIIMPLFLMLLIFILSCATGNIKMEFLRAYSQLSLKKIEILQVEPEKLLERMEALTVKISGKKEFKSQYDYDDVISELEKITGQYNSVMNAGLIADYEDGSYIIPPRSEVRVTVDTYCLDSGSAIPNKNEPYVLTKNDPDIPVFRELMVYTNTKEQVDKSFKQRLIWNLGNRVKFENLSVEEKELLLKADPAAYLKLDSYFKDEFVSLLFKAVPILKDIRKAAGLAKGVAHTYEDYAKNIEQIISKYDMPEIGGPIKADGYELYTVIEPSSYHKACITFINTEEETIRVKCFFKPFRKDVQPLGFDLPPYYDNTLKQKLKVVFGKLVSASVDKGLKLNLKSGDKLTIEENPERLLDIWKVYKDGEKAWGLTRDFCGKNPGTCTENMHNCIGDAFRHAVWNAMMERDVGDFAIEAANNHELNEDSVPVEAEMDRYNNEIGREIGKTMKEQGITDDKAIAEEILKNFERLKVIIK